MFKKIAILLKISNCAENYKNEEEIVCVNSFQRKGRKHAMLVHTRKTVRIKNNNNNNNNPVYIISTVKSQLNNNLN